MNTKNPVILFLLLFFICFSFNAFSQADCEIIQISHGTIASNSYNINYWFGLMEMPFLFISVFFAFSTAIALKGGKFGKGMKLLAWGFLVMAVGHFHMQLEHFYGFNLFHNLFGQMGGSIAWFIALIITWGLSGLGFYSIHKASRGE